MKVILFGATGMVGQGVLRECLLDPSVEAVLAIGREPLKQRDPKLSEITLKGLFGLSAMPGIEARLAGYDACFFCLGVSSAGMKEADYTRLTYDLTLALAQLLVKSSPEMTFIYVSGESTDSSEKGRSMWARVKGRTENALLRLPFKAAYMFRPGYIQPMDGIVSKTPAYRVIYASVGWMYPMLKAAFPKFVTSTEEVGRAMVRVAKDGWAQTILRNEDISRVGGVANR